MAKESKAQREIITRVMHEFKEGDLERGRGGTVRNPKQAIAIALSEAGASNQQSPQENRHRLAKTKQAQRAAHEGTREQLYEEAKRKGIAGRSRMTKRSWTVPFAAKQKPLRASRD